MNNYQDMKYNDLKSLAKERGLNATGTKEDLLASLTEADGSGVSNTGTPSPSADESNNGDEASEQSEAETPENVTEQSEAETPAPKKDESKMNDVQLHRSRALIMKARLDKQPKVKILIPFNQGEHPEQAKKIPFHVSINGWTIDIPRGSMQEVPEQVAKMVYERLESEGRIGSQHRVDADPARQEALS